MNRPAENVVAARAQSAARVRLARGRSICGPLRTLGRVLANDAGMRRPTPFLQHTVGDFMTASPHSIGRDQPLSVAHERMRALGVRHLPVLEHGKLAGILSQRDALLVETLRDVDPATTPVEEAMSTDVYVVGPDTPLKDVAESMMEHRYGCAVVMDAHRVVGIFTTIDALRALASAAGSDGHRR
jgi:acetoin utilization protein AcuB